MVWFWVIGICIHAVESLLELVVDEYLSELDFDATHDVIVIHSNLLKLFRFSVLWCTYSPLLLLNSCIELRLKVILISHLLIRKRRLHLGHVFLLWSHVGRSTLVYRQRRMVSHIQWALNTVSLGNWLLRHWWLSHFFVLSLFFARVFIIQQHLELVYFIVVCERVMMAWMCKYVFLVDLMTPFAPVFRLFCLGFVSLHWCLNIKARLQHFWAWKRSDCVFNWRIWYRFWDFDIGRSTWCFFASSGALFWFLDLGNFIVIVEFEHLWLDLQWRWSSLFCLFYLHRSYIYLLNYLLFLAYLLFLSYHRHQQFRNNRLFLHGYWFWLISNELPCRFGRSLLRFRLMPFSSSHRLREGGLGSS